MNVWYARKIISTNLVYPYPGIFLIPRRRTPDAPPCIIGEFGVTLPLLSAAFSIYSWSRRAEAPASVVK